MKITNKKLILTALTTGLLTTICMGGISSSADEVISENIDFTQVTSKVLDVYRPNKFYLSTVKASDISTTSNLSLSEYLASQIKNFNTTIDISSYGIDADSSIIKDTISRIMLEYPELFYVDSSFSKIYNPATNKLVSLKLHYSCTSAEYPQLLQTIDSKFSEITSKIDDSMSDFEKALAIHDYICTNFSYDNSYTIYDIYNFVLNDTGVCQAYMLAYSYVLDKFGIESYPVISNEINHTWNMVQLDGNYYQIDVTWDDYNPELFGWSSHTNFLLTDDEVSSSSHSDQWYMYQEASATDTTYQSYAFKSNSFPYIIINYDLYCLDKGNFCEYNFNENSLTKISSLVSNYKWYNFNSSIKGSYYISKYSSLNYYEDVIFYNTPNEILITDTSGKILDTVYTYTSSTDAIYGIAIKDGKLLAQIEPNLNANRDDFSTNIVEVGDVEELYQLYKSKLAETTTPEITETSIQTTTPEITETSIQTTTLEMIETSIQTTTPEVIETSIQTTEPEILQTTTIETTETSIEVTTEPTLQYHLDINDDDVIDTIDLLILKSYLINRNSSNFYFDVDKNGTVNILDVLILKNKLINTKE